MDPFHVQWLLLVACRIFEPWLIHWHSIVPDTMIRRLPLKQSLNVNSASFRHNLIWKSNLWDWMIEEEFNDCSVWYSWCWWSRRPVVVKNLVQPWDAKIYIRYDRLNRFTPKNTYLGTFTQKISHIYPESQGLVSLIYHWRLKKPIALQNTSNEYISKKSGRDRSELVDTRYLSVCIVGCEQKKTKKKPNKADRWKKLSLKICKVSWKTTFQLIQWVGGAVLFQQRNCMKTEFYH